METKSLFEDSIIIYDMGFTIKKKRLKLGLTQKEFADALKMGKNGDRTLRRWENGETKPSLLEFDAILNFPERPPFPNPVRYSYSMIDLFAGIGGIRLGFYHHPVKVVFASEWDKFAAKTYNANFGEIPHGDITKIDESDIPDHDILTAGFPCQPFSQAGLGKGFDDTRGTLFFDIARIIREKRPRAFLLENVKRLVTHDKGNTFRIIIDTLNSLNYDVKYKVLRSADFGVPQNRERIYIVGLNREYPFSDQFVFPEGSKKKTRVGDILEKSVDKKYTISDDLWQGHQRRKAEHMRKGNGFGFSLFNEDSPYTNTLSARYYKDGSEILIEQSGANPRKLTPRECARLQGFPDKFVITVSDTQSYKQFGNSVAVPVIKKIADNLVSILEMQNNELDKNLKTKLFDIV